MQCPICEDLCRFHVLENELVNLNIYFCLRRHYEYHRIVNRFRVTFIYEKIGYRIYPGFISESTFNLIYRDIGLLDEYQSLIRNS